ncbi:MAG: hypothetical protein IKG99_00635, partial [Bacteroidaceae bacterium]|nr:hypothetical protein [Bacteroidaceae bacterium]
MKINVFVKPNEQSQTCLGYAMARKGRMKSNVFVKPNEQSQTCLGYAMARKGRMKSNFKTTRFLPTVISTLMVCAMFGLTACNSSTTKTNNTDGETTKVEETT